MIRGNQKKVIHIKNTQSCIFDEAYFILKEDSSISVPKNDMINEANRIIEENLKGVCDGRKEGRLFVYKRLAFLFSAVAAAVLAVLLIHLFLI